MTSRSVTITLELRQAGDELAGRASDGSTDRSFSGWLGLIGTIDALLDAAPSDESAASGQSH